MVMRYSNRSYVLLPILCAALGACTASHTRESSRTTPEAPLELIDTSQFLPVKQQDEHGLSIPYEPEPNPYTQLHRQIDKRAVLTFIDARRAFDDYDFRHAEKLLSDLQEEHPQLSGPMVLHGDIETARGNLSAAVEKYQQAIEVNPLNFNAWIRLARAQRMQGDFQLAQNSYAEALQRWPDGAELHWNLGVLYDVYLNMPKRAQAHMEAYQLLSGDNSGKIAAWLREIRERTGLKTALMVQGPGKQTTPMNDRESDPDETASAVASKSLEE
jgi:tetratricopeptide (TPR) repeat protein